MKKKNERNGTTFRNIIIFIIILVILTKITGKENVFSPKGEFTIIASTSMASMDKDLKDYARKNNMYLNIEHYGDLEIVSKLNDDSSNYDAVWISNKLPNIPPSINPKEIPSNLLLISVLQM